MEVAGCTSSKVKIISSTKISTDNLGKHRTGSCPVARVGRSREEEADPVDGASGNTIEGS